MSPAVLDRLIKKSRGTVTLVWSIRQMRWDTATALLVFFMAEPVCYTQFNRDRSKVDSVHWDTFDLQEEIIPVCRRIDVPRLAVMARPDWAMTHRPTERQRHH